ncbi:hypothetical protein F5Y18DRAFT_433934 [Xylariaceae sp. FL1019]|nr:hypothetical protein F5Y18DRAFT_433934 [Xylariaceae sp. FL1019]
MDGLTHRLVVISITFIAVTTLAVGMRLWVRLGIVKIWGWDDVLLSVSQVALIVHLSLIAAAAPVGLTVSGQLTAEQSKWVSIYQIPISIFYSCSVLTAKASFAILYLRLFPMKALRILNKILIVFIASQLLEEIFVPTFRCVPIAKLWVVGSQQLFLGSLTTQHSLLFVRRKQQHADSELCDLNRRPEIPGHCVNIHPFWYTSFVFNLIVDLTLFIEPIPFTLKLQMPLVKRIALLFMMSLGLLVTAISVIRLYYIVGYSNGSTVPLAIPTLWSATEAVALILAACIPSLRQVAGKIPGLNSMLGLSSGRTGGDSNAIYAGKSNRSIPLGTLNRKEYIQSETPKNHRSNHFGPTTRITATSVGLGDNDSQEEIFPNSSDYHGAIMITREVVHKVES